MTTNSQLSTNEPKRKEKQQKLSEQLEQEENHRNGYHREELLMGKGKGKNGEKGTGNKKCKW